MTTRMPHQEEAFIRQRGQPAFALFLEMGLGKTKIAIDEAAQLHEENRIDRLLVVAPNGVHLAWEREIEKHAPGSLKRNVFGWRGSLTKKEESALARSMKNATELTVLLLNVEALSTSTKAKDLVRSFVGPRAMFVVDESSRIKNPGAKRTKFVVAAGRRCGYRRILTGTPVTQSPFDLYSQFMFLDPMILGFPSYRSFCHRYGEFSTEEAKRGRQPDGTFEKEWTYEKVVGYRRLGELTRTIASHMVRMRKEDCLDLPAKIYEVVPIVLTPQQRALYKSMDKDGVAEFDSFEVLSPLRITRLMKMSQIVSGFLIDEDQIPRIIPGRNPKLETFIDIVSNHTGKVLVSCRFHHEIRLIRDTLREMGETVVEYHGEVSTKDRRAGVEAFQKDPKVRFMVGQEKALIGETLTAADLMIYWSNEFSYEARYQSEDRLHRIGQDKSVVYVDLVGEKTVDERVVQILERCRLVADKVIDGKDLPDTIRKG